MTHTIGMISLGCAKNQVNAEHMLWLLRQAGYEISPDPDGAELVIVNTCGFIESAKTEAIDNILAMAQLKAEGRIQKILVTGCLAQRYQEEILKELPEVDGVLGTGSYYDVANAVGQVLSGKRYKRFDDINADQSEDGRILTTPEYYAYLKIAEGCDNHCAYCVIPKLRGKLRSRPMEDLIKEAEQLASDGVKELIVVAQDTSRYGIDLYGERRLPELLRAFRAEHPEIQLDVLVRSEELTTALASGRIQLALVDEARAKGFDFQPLADAPLVAVVPPDFPWEGDTIPLERLLREPFLSSPDQYIEPFLPADAPRVEVSASDDGAILSMVAAGLGVAVLSSFSLVGYEERVRVLQLEQPIALRLGAAVKSINAAGTSARTFLSFLCAYYGQEERL